MGETAVTTDYIAAAANRYSHAADLSPSTSLVAFGSHKFVALWDPTDNGDRGVLQTLPGHEGLVTCVRFVSSAAFVSADDKGVIRWWRKSGSQFTIACVVRAHEKSISAIGYCDRCLVTGASDSVVKIWTMSTDDQTAAEITKVQQISMDDKYPLAIELTRLPQSTALILAISGTLRNVKIYTRSDDNFVPSATLPGHEDWIRGLAFRNPTADGVPLLLASGSQDSTIRLWSIEFLVSPSATKETEAGDDLLDTFEASLGDLAEGEEGGRQISLKRHILSVKDSNSSVQKFSITFDALLIGHESHITSVSWQPGVPGTAPSLLSTSTDSSLILWTPSSSLWINQQRFGDIGGQRLGGFVGGLWGMDGKEVLAWGWNGGWRRWRCSTSAEEESWSEIGAITGHNDAVKDICWSPRGEYLLSASLDQTTRIHGPVLTSPSSNHVWHEISRPQIHGYDLVGVQFLDALTFVSVADEKVARIFEAPRTFVHQANALRVANLSEVDETTRPVGASVPPLGLSNKAVSEDTSDLSVSNSHSSEARRPFEGELASTTLWPEIEKVFGHGYELISVATSMSKSLFATSCKSSSPAHAVVRINDVSNNYQLLGMPLEGHSLTVTRIAFRPPDDEFILTVSRDRTWQLFQKRKEGSYTPAASDKSHGRIIWDCAWSSEGDIFATVSRDKTVKIWHSIDDSPWTATAVLKVKEAATAVAFSPTDLDNRRRLAVGIETGHILIYSSVQSGPSEWRLDLTIDSSVAHIDQIHRLAWRPSNPNPDRLDDDDPHTQTASPRKKQLASCSEDHTLRVLSVPITT